MEGQELSDNPGENLGKTFVNACRSTGTHLDMWSAVGAGLAIRGFFDLDKEEQGKFLSYVAPLHTRTDGAEVV